MMHLVLSHLRWEMLFSLLVAGFIARIAIPPIVRVSKTKNMVVVPNGRTSHSGSIPYLGGVSIFASLAISASMFVVDGFNAEFQYIIPALIIIFFVGVKDDVADLAARTKFIAQIVASLLIIVLADVRVMGMHGLFGIDELPLYVSYGFSLLVFLAIMNAFNLIDGIDGLASGLGIQISILLGFWLAFLQKYDYAVFAFALTGGLIPFYIYNVFGKKYKLFMGDTGSLLIGLVFATLAVKILGSNLPEESKLYAEGIPILVASTIIIPITDMVRLFAFRISKGKSPFKADKNHFHHYLLARGLNHWQASTIIVILNFILFIIAFVYRHLDDLSLAILMFSLSLIVTVTPWLFTRMSNSLKSKKVQLEKSRA